MKSNAFVDFLVSQTPVYDQLILKDICPRDGWIGKSKPWFDLLPCDVRFLPNKFRPIWAYRQAHPKSQVWRIAKKFRIKTQTAKYRIQLCDEIADDRLRRWLKTLPKDKRRRQVYRRRTTWRKHRISWKWKPGNESERFHGTWSDFKSDYPPPKPIKSCSDMPCDPDPWGPMRHWDD